MLTWAVPWVYLAVVGGLYLFVGESRAGARTWLRANINTWLALTIVLVMLGIGGTVFFRAQWLQVLAWFAGVAAIAWTVYQALRGQEEVPASPPFDEKDEH